MNKLIMIIVASGNMLATELPAQLLKKHFNGVPISIKDKIALLEEQSKDLAQLETALQTLEDIGKTFPRDKSLQASLLPLLRQSIHEPHNHQQVILLEKIVQVKQQLTVGRRELGEQQILLKEKLKEKIKELEECIDRLHNTMNHDRVLIDQLLNIFHIPESLAPKAYKKLMQSVLFCFICKDPIQRTVVTWYALNDQCFPSFSCLACYNKKHDRQTESKLSFDCCNQSHDERMFTELPKEKHCYSNMGTQTQ